MINMDELLTISEDLTFNLEIIKRGGFIRAKATGWEDFRNGLITYANKDLIRAIFMTGTNSAASYFKITAADVNAGLWTIAYSFDLEDVYHGAGYTEPTESEQDAG